MRLTMRTNLAIRTLMYCAVNANQTVRTSDVASACNASENHLGQVVRTLAKNGLVEASRGRNGGLHLALPARSINIGAVFRAFEADLPFAECFGPDNSCPLVDVCWLRDAIRDAVEAFFASLDKVSLADLVDDNTPLRHLLELDPAVTATPGIVMARCERTQPGRG